MFFIPFTYFSINLSLIHFKFCQNRNLLKTKSKMTFNRTKYSLEFVSLEPSSSSLIYTGCPLPLVHVCHPGMPIYDLAGDSFIHYQIPCYPEHVSTHFWQNMMKISIQLCLHNYVIAMSEILRSTFPRSWGMDITDLRRSYQYVLQRHFTFI